jgi:DNA repair exonuclease SbcCD nuclease subunit
MGGFVLGHITDMHLNPLDRIPKSRKEKFHEQIEAKFADLARIVKERGVDALCVSGDIFHLKRGKSYDPKSILRYSALFDGLGCQVFAIPGNHDLEDSAFARQESSPYYLLCKASRNVWNLTEPGNAIGSTGAYKIGLGDLGLDMVIYGIPYYPASWWGSDRFKFLADEPRSFRVCLAHGDFIPDSNVNLFWKVMSYGDFMEYTGGGFHVALLGHIHQSFPVQRLGHGVTDGTVISKPWSFTRVVKDYFVSAEDLAIRHSPCVNLFKFDVSDFGPIGLREVEPVNIACAVLRIRSWRRL